MALKRRAASGDSSSTPSAASVARCTMACSTGRMRALPRSACSLSSRLRKSENGSSSMSRMAMPRRHSSSAPAPFMATPISSLSCSPCSAAWLWRSPSASPSSVPPLPLDGDEYCPSVSSWSLSSSNTRLVGIFCPPRSVSSRSRTSFSSMTAPLVARSSSMNATALRSIRCAAARTSSVGPSLATRSMVGRNSDKRRASALRCSAVRSSIGGARSSSSTARRTRGISSPSARRTGDARECAARRSRSDGPLTNPVVMLTKSSIPSQRSGCIS
mmetsp:Transcript_19735/g.49460  ORF Transcript_19735/g.49460 Transcript_19735/m.49460 type:complete len:273 (+) Transcript_19735:488-1306(+)